MTYPPHTRYYLGFNLVPRIGPARLARLVERCGSIEAAWHATPGDLLAAGLDAKACATLQEKRQKLDLDAEMERLERASVRLLTIEDADYPRLLSEAPTAPPLLYLRGALDITDEWAVAVVGTRSPTTYGKEAARHIAGELAQRGVTIISGLASGIDAIAHTAALEAGGRTIGVLGCGVDMVYPERNRELTSQMVKQGAIISDYPLGTRPHAANFPPRNRIISGLALGTVIVEAGEKSGALITGDFALEQGRDVFAVPGSIFSQKSKGTNNLLRNGAGVATCADDILEALNLMAAPVQQEFAAALLADPADPTEARILEHLDAEPQPIDQLTRASGLPAEVVSATLTMLQLKGLVRQVGSDYVRAR
jgi:DNA processing protein